jgi:hypothetical protein
MNASVLLQEVVSVAENDVCVNVIDAREQEVIRVDQVVRDGGVVGLDADEQGPTKVEHFARCAGRFPGKTN